MKAVQLRFSLWYNSRTGRRGTLWENRFTSVIVEEEQRALRTMAAYIDLNPVRAGMVTDPADYRWSGYAEAMAGKARSRC
jgi:putative transposase